ncbi:hypothetical protein GS597_09490 [Synechococcales cyanobacterium C]|uniref:Uncharacterized protein n=1 Tax=Petrachloros mirabilis ULC683 TaxID=2781853 RepID=A0A8K1ZWW3_9CYAN|nr:hypothetical protein [Petrachloros mirabilis]NCJ06735.1 hypothetical protein [Petrachloros mirabilis ULC683]
MNVSESLEALLTPEECAMIDQTLLPTRDRFSMRITVYSLRYLKQIGAGLGMAIADLTSEQIKTWVQQEPQMQTQANLDASFVDWFTHLLTASLVPLQTIAQHEVTEIEELTLPQIVAWFEHQVKPL